MASKLNKEVMGNIKEAVAGIDPSLPPLDRVKVFLETARNRSYKGFDNELIEKHLRIVSADPSGKVLYKLTVPLSFTNRFGNLHGGAAALIFDVCTTGALAPMAADGWHYAGVTRALNVTYLRPAPLNEEVDVVCEVVHAGKRLATIKGEIRSQDGKVLCMAEHLKVSIDPPKGAPPPVVGGRL